MTQRDVLRPQRLLAEANRDATRMRQPVGLGLDSPQVRARMCERLTRVAGPQVLAAIAQVPRHQFVEAAFAPQAYEDTALPIGHGQTISKPSVVARMMQLLLEGASARRLGGLGRALEIGTGCGYQAAVLACLARQVVSVERIGALHLKAQAHLRDWTPPVPVRLVHADGRLGDRWGGPFDSIVAAAGGEDIPEAWLAQLAPGGRLVAPVADGMQQALVVVDHEVVNGIGQMRRQRHEAVSFVPLRSGLA